MDGGKTLGWACAALLSDHVGWLCTWRKKHGERTGERETGRRTDACTESIVRCRYKYRLGVEYQRASGDSTRLAERVQYSPRAKPITASDAQSLQCLHLPPIPRRNFAIWCGT